MKLKTNVSQALQAFSWCLRRSV